MPYEWIEPNLAKPDPPTAELHVWPFRSLPRRGQVVFIGATAALVVIPLIAVIGSPVLWGLLPFILAALAAVWWAIERSYKDGAVLETLCIWPERITLSRQNPRGADQTWESNPYWTELSLHPKEGPVEDYLTLKGAGRTVELGAFLAPEERQALHKELSDRLRKITAA